MPRAASAQGEVTVCSGCGRLVPAVRAWPVFAGHGCAQQRATHPTAVSIDMVGTLTETPAAHDVEPVDEDQRGLALSLPGVLGRGGSLALLASAIHLASARASSAGAAASCPSAWRSRVPASRSRSSIRTSWRTRTDGMVPSLSRRHSVRSEI